MRLLAVQAVARHHGFELDRTLTSIWMLGTRVPSPLSLVKWLRDQGLVAKASRFGLGATLPADRGCWRGHGVACRVVVHRWYVPGFWSGPTSTRDIVWIRDPRSTAQDAVAVDRLRLSQLWNGESRAGAPATEPIRQRPAVLARLGHGAHLRSAQADARHQHCIAELVCDDDRATVIGHVGDRSGRWPPQLLHACMLLSCISIESLRSL